MENRSRTNQLPKAAEAKKRFSNPLDTRAGRTALSFSLALGIGAGAERVSAQEPTQELLQRCPIVEIVRKPMPVETMGLKLNYGETGEIKRTLPYLQILDGMLFRQNETRIK